MIQDIKFTLDQIHQAFRKVKSGEDFPQLVQDFKSLGITHNDVYVQDGRSIYYGENGYKVEDEAIYPEKIIQEESSVELLKNALSIHQQGQTDYPTFCQQAADAGVEKWIIHMDEMTVSYLDKKGNILVVESIPQPK